MQIGWELIYDGSALMKTIKVDINFVKFCHSNVF